MMKEKTENKRHVYIIRGRDGILYGCFDSLIKAQKYIEGSNKLDIRKIEVC